MLSSASLLCPSLPNPRDVFLALPTIDRDVHGANSTRSRPCQASDFIESGARELLIPGKKDDHEINRSVKRGGRPIASGCPEVYVIGR